jgi:site-specific DNA-methyltransferase (adenine-specific)
MQTARRKENGHPAPFPEELPLRCIKLFSYIGDNVLDPFVGEGTTSYIAKKLGRNSIGIDSTLAYIKMSESRLGRLDGSIEQSVKPISILTTL